MSDLNPLDKAVNFALLPCTNPTNKTIQIDGFQNVGPDILILRHAKYSIGEVVKVYPDAAPAHVADEANTLNYNPDEMLIGLITKVVWLPHGLDDAGLEVLTHEDRTYMYIMKRIDTAQDKTTKTLIKFEEDVRPHEQQPRYEIGQFVQVPAVEYDISHTAPHMRIWKVANIEWNHGEDRLHYHLIGAKDPQHDDMFDSEDNALMLVAEEIARHAQPKFNNRQEVQIIADVWVTRDESEDGSKYQVSHVWRDTVLGDVMYKIAKIHGPTQGETEKYVRERSLLLAVSDSSESEYLS